MKSLAELENKIRQMFKPIFHNYSICDYDNLITLDDVGHQWC